jgi:hypothetical protein
MAFLLGCKNGSKVSRYEAFSRLPNPKTIFAYAIICRAMGRDIFAGVYQAVEKKVARRAYLLARRLPTANPDAVTLRKLQALKAISGSENEPNQNI